MPKVVMYGRCETENTVISLETLETAIFGLNAVSHVCSFQEGT
jgi:hypothetical protein